MLAISPRAERLISSNSVTGSPIMAPATLNADPLAKPYRTLPRRLPLTPIIAVMSSVVYWWETASAFTRLSGVFSSFSQTSLAGARKALTYSSFIWYPFERSRMRRPNADVENSPQCEDPRPHLSGNLPLWKYLAGSPLKHSPGCEGFPIIWLGDIFAVRHVCPASRGDKVGEGAVLGIWV